MMQRKSNMRLRYTYNDTYTLSRLLYENDTPIVLYDQLLGSKVIIIVCNITILWVILLYPKIYNHMIFIIKVKQKNLFVIVCLGSTCLLGLSSGRVDLQVPMQIIPITEFRSGLVFVIQHYVIKFGSVLPLICRSAFLL